jgi:putative transposase
VEDLAALNRLFFAFVEGEYHVRRHRGIGGETPLDRWMRLSGGIRPLRAETDLDELFLEEVRRRVRRDGTLTLRGKTFEAGPGFVSRKVVVRYDPFDLRFVRVRSEAGGPEMRAFPVDLRGNRHVARGTPKEAPKRTPPPLRSLEEQARRLEEEGPPRPPASSPAPEDLDDDEEGEVARG